MVQNGGNGKPSNGSKDMSDVPAEPVEQNLSFEQLRTRLPKEITDDIVKIVATSEVKLYKTLHI